MSNKSDFPRPSITGDVIVIRASDTHVLLIKRKSDPYAGFWAFPGGFFNSEDHHGEKMDISIEACAKRELLEELSIDADEVTKDTDNTDFQFVGICDTPGRDPRGRVVTFVFALIIKDESVAGFNPKPASDATEMKWIDIEDILKDRVLLAFDHKDYLIKFLQKMVDEKNIIEKI